MAALGGFGVALLLVVPLAWWWLRRFVGTAEGTLQRVISNGAAATRAAAQSDAPGAVTHAENALHEAAAWYGPIAARRFTVQTALALVVTFGGLVGTGLLFRQTLLLGEQTIFLGKQNEKLDEQTALLRDQNTKLDLQTVTAEAQRRAGLAAALFSILQAVSQLTPPGEAGERRKEAIQLPSGLVARVIAFSRATARYWIAEVPDRTKDGEVPVPRFADRLRSPERGQLLVGLITAGVDVPALAVAGTTFADADLRSAALRRTRLRFADLQDAELRVADLHGADLQGANLLRADLRSAILQRANLQGAVLQGADLRSTILRVAVLRGAVLQDANLRGAVLQGAVLQGADLQGAVLQGADLRSAILQRANLQGADLQSADLQGADLQGANVGDRFNFTPGQLPKDFPRGWSAAPAGWELLVDDGATIRLRRISAPAAAPPSPPQ